MNPLMLGLMMFGIGMAVFVIVLVGAVLASGPRSKKFQTMYDRRHDGREGINE